MKTVVGLFLAVMFVLAIAMSSFASTSSVTLAWDAVTAPDLAGYRVYQANVSGGEIRTTGKVCDVGKTVTTCTVQGLADGTYYFTATAYDAKGNESPFSNEVSDTTDTVAPEAPPGLRITATITVTVNP